MKYYLLLVLGFTFININAQKHIDIVKLSYSNTPLNKFEDSQEKTNVSQYAMELNFPVVLNEKHTLLTGVFGNRSRLKFDDNISNYLNVNTIGLKIGLNSNYSDKWSGTYLLLPKLSSDLANVSEDDFQLGVVALANYKKRENLKFKFGFYFNTESYGSLFVPLVGLYYLSPNNKLETNLTLPLKADVNYLLSKIISVGMNFDGLGSSYNLNEVIYTPTGEYLTIKSNELFGYFRFKIGESFNVKTKAGYSFYRTSEIYSDDDLITYAIASLNVGDNRVPLNDNFKDGPIFKIELLYTLHFK